MALDSPPAKHRILDNDRKEALKFVGLYFGPPAVIMIALGVAAAVQQQVKAHRYAAEFCATGQTNAIPGDTISVPVHDVWSGGEKIIKVKLPCK